MARDLRPDDALVPVFTSEPLPADLDIVGVASVVLSWESPVPVATAVVRLQDVTPDGTPFQVSAGILNLTHRASHAAPEALEPGVVTEVRIDLRSTAHRFRAGHRIRLSVASSMWPVVWPSPFPAEFGIHLGGAGGSRLILPTLPAGHVGADVPPFKTTPAGRRELGSYRGDPPTWQVVEDVIDGSVTVVTSEFGESTLPDGRTTLYTGERLEMTARDADPAIDPSGRQGSLAISEGHLVVDIGDDHPVFIGDDAAYAAVVVAVAVGVDHCDDRADTEVAVHEVASGCSGL